MPSEYFIPGLNRTLCFVFQHSGANSNNIRPRPDVPVDEMINILPGEYHGVPNTAPRDITREVFEFEAPEVSITYHICSHLYWQSLTPSQPVGFETRPAQGQQANITSQDPPRPPGPPLYGNNNYLTSEADSSRAARQSPADGELGCSRRLTIRSTKPNKTRIAVLIAAALSLVVVPSLVLGVATKQIDWGIALSGAIATVVSFFAGLYYYHNK